ncbi:hypothetical protein QJQ45_029876, partial [Haematococcus lacustris]
MHLAALSPPGIGQWTPEYPGFAGIERGVYGGGDQHRIVAAVAAAGLLNATSLVQSAASAMATPGTRDDVPGCCPSRKLEDTYSSYCSPPRDGCAELRLVYLDLAQLLLQSDSAAVGTLDEQAVHDTLSDVWLRAEEHFILRVPKTSDTGHAAVLQGTMAQLTQLARNRGCELEWVEDVTATLPSNQGSDPIPEPSTSSDPGPTSTADSDNSHGSEVGPGPSYPPSSPLPPSAPAPATETSNACGAIVASAGNNPSSSTAHDRSLDSAHDIDCGPSHDHSPNPEPCTCPGHSSSSDPGPTPDPASTPDAAPSPGPAPNPEPSSSSDPGPTPDPASTLDAAPSPGPAPNPEPSSSSDPGPTPDPASTPDAAPSPGPAPNPEPSSSSDPGPTPDPASTPDAAPSPGPAPNPEPSSSSDPGPTPDPASTLDAAPSPGPAPNPEPSSSSDPGPTPDPASTPDAAPSPGPAPNPEPSSSSDPGPTPDPASTLDAAPSPGPAPNPEPSSSSDPGPTPDPASTPDAAPSPGPAPNPEPSSSSDPGPTPDLSPFSDNANPDESPTLSSLKRLLQTTTHLHCFHLHLPPAARAAGKGLPTARRAVDEGRKQASDPHSADLYAKPLEAEQVMQVLRLVQLQRGQEVQMRPHLDPIWSEVVYLWLPPSSLAAVQLDRPWPDPSFPGFSRLTADSHLSDQPVPRHDRSLLYPGPSPETAARWAAVEQMLKGAARREMLGGLTEASRGLAQAHAAQLTQTVERKDTVEMPGLPSGYEKGEWWGNSAGDVSGGGATARFAVAAEYGYSNDEDNAMASLRDLGAYRALQHDRVQHLREALAAKRRQRAIRDPGATNSWQRQQSILMENQQAANQRLPHVQAIQVQRQALPIHASKQQLLEAIERNPVTIVSGETGSGKSTQLPQFLLEEAVAAGRGAAVSLVVTQPRRISTISLARRVAQERGEALGDVVGYKVRLDSCVSRNTRLTYMTSGLLLRRLLIDPDLEDTTHVFIDEVHERHTNTDFTLIALKRLLARRPGFKIVLMSATLQAQRFATYFGSAASCFAFPGRNYPVQQYYLEDFLQESGITPFADDQLRKANIELSSLVRRLAEEEQLKQQAATPGQEGSGIPSLADLFGWAGGEQQSQLQVQALDKPMERQGQWQQVEGQQVEGQQAVGQQLEGQQVEGQQVEGQEAEGERVKGQQVKGQRVKGQRVKGQRVKGQQVEGQQAEGQQVKGQRVKGQRVKGQRVKGQQVEGQQAEGQQVKGQRVKGQRVRGQRVKGQRVKGQQMQEQRVERQQLEGQHVEGQQMQEQRVEWQQEQGQQAEGQQEVGQQEEGQQVEGQQVEGQQAVGQQAEGQQEVGQQEEGQQVEVQHVEGQQVEGKQVEGQQVKGQQVEGQQVEGQQVEGQQVEGLQAEGLQVEGQQVEGQQVEGLQVEGQQVEGQQVEGQQVEGQQVEGQQVEGQQVERQQVEGQQVEGQHVEGQQVKAGKQLDEGGQGGGRQEGQQRHQQREQKGTGRPPPAEEPWQEENLQVKPQDWHCGFDLELAAKAHAQEMRPLSRKVLLGLKAWLEQRDGKVRLCCLTDSSSTCPTNQQVDLFLAAAVVRHLHATQPPGGAILVLLPGWQDIERLRALLTCGAETWGQLFGARQQQGRGGSLGSGSYGNNGDADARSAQPLDSSAPPQAQGQISPQPVEGMWVLPCHSSLTREEQQRVFDNAPPGSRKVVLATNIAETSITIPDVTVVVDSGRSRQVGYDPLNKTKSLTQGWISQSSAEQRKGRAGRVQPGVCYRLYPRLFWQHHMAPHDVPELQRTPLEEVCLQVLNLELGDPAAFLAEALDPPEALAVENALTLLQNIGAIQPTTGLPDQQLGAEAKQPGHEARNQELSAAAIAAEGNPAPFSFTEAPSEWQLTQLGRALAALPLDPRLGKMLILGAAFGKANYSERVKGGYKVNVCGIKSATGRLLHLDACRRLGAVGGDANSDHMAIDAGWALWYRLGRRGEGAGAEYVCQPARLSAKQLYYMQKTRLQLAEQLMELGLIASSDACWDAAVRRANPHMQQWPGSLAATFPPPGAEGERGWEAGFGARNQWQQGWEAWEEGAEWVDGWGGSDTLGWTGQGRGRGVGQSVAQRQQDVSPEVLAEVAWQAPGWQKGWAVEAAIKEHSWAAGDAELVKGLLVAGLQAPQLARVDFMRNQESVRQRVGKDANAVKGKYRFRLFTTDEGQVMLPNSLSNSLLARPQNWLNK